MPVDHTSPTYLFVHALLGERPEPDLLAALILAKAGHTSTPYLVNVVTGIPPDAAAAPEASRPWPDPTPISPASSPSPAASVTPPTSTTLSTSSNATATSV